MSRIDSGEYGFSGKKGPHGKANYESINKSNERREREALIKKYGKGSLEREVEAKQIFYNNLKNQPPSAVPEGAKNVGVRAFSESRKVFRIPKKESSPKKNVDVSLGGGRKRKTHKKRRVSRKVKKTYRKRR